MSCTRRAVLAAAALFLALGFAPASAQAVTTAETGTLTGPDRLQRLLAGAQKEGVVDVYSSATTDIMDAVRKGFAKKYPGIRINVWKSSSIAILQRALTEARGGRFAVDVIETPASELEALHREKLLQDVKLPVFAELMPQAVAPGRGWIASRVIIFEGAYNTNLVKPADLPKSYQDLLNPKWRGRIGIEGTDANWFMSLVKTMGEDKGVKLFKDIAATNGLSTRQGHTTLTNMVVSGEVPLALNVYRHFVLPAKAEGAPIAELQLSPVLAVPSGAAVMRRAPHPYAAVLFLDYLLSDGQPLLNAGEGGVPTNLKYQKLPKGLKISFIDVPGYVTENEKWRRLYREVQTTKPRAR
jgi:iron(III) transport system substrate-binding protein